MQNITIIICVYWVFERLEWTYKYVAITYIIYPLNEMDTPFLHHIIS